MYIFGTWCKIIRKNFNVNLDAFSKYLLWSLAQEPQYPNLIIPKFDKRKSYNINENKGDRNKGCN